MNFIYCTNCASHIHRKAPICPHCLVLRDVDWGEIRYSDACSSETASEKNWALRFRLIDQAGGAGMPYWQRLTFSELLTVHFNPWAMLFGPGYFMYLGLWRDALWMSARWISLPAIGLLLIDGVLALRADRPTALSLDWNAVRPLVWFAIWLVAAIAFAVKANRAFALHTRLPLD